MVKKWYNREVLLRIRAKTEFELIQYMKPIIVSFQLVHMLEDIEKVYVLRFCREIPIKIQKYLIGKHFISNYSNEIRYLCDLMSGGYYDKNDFHGYHPTLKDKYKILRKRPVYIKYMLEDERAKSIIVRYHPEYYASNWNFGYEMDLLAIKIGGLNKESTFNHLLKKRKTVHPSIQFEYFRPHKHQFNNEDYDLSFKYDS